MRLILLHGRNTPGEDMNGWGFDGPTITGIEAVHFTYNNAGNIFFTSKRAAERAKKLTGWEVWDEHALTMRLHEDLLVANGKFYGDWEFQIGPPRRRK